MKKILITLCLLIICVAALTVAGCTDSDVPAISEEDAYATANDTVIVEYTATLADGTVVFNYSVGKEPLTFTLGTGTVIPGFNDAVVGMKIDETKIVTIPFDQAYGAHNPGLVMEMPNGQLPEGMVQEVGQTVYMVDGNGNPTLAVVSEIRNDSVVLDLNHPLVGEDLTFTITLLGKQLPQA